MLGCWCENDKISGGITLASGDLTVICLWSHKITFYITIYVSYVLVSNRPKREIVNVRRKVSYSY